MSMHIGHVALRVTDLERSLSHARLTLGLMETSRDERTITATSNQKYCELQLLRAEQAGLDHIGLEVETEAQLEAVRDRVIADGAKVLSEVPQENGLEQAIRVLGPGGLVFEIYRGMRRAPLSLENVLRPVAQKLGHVTLFSEDKAELERFILQTLGFRVSDRWGEDVTWMRCDSDHHGLAVGATARGTRMHHYAFELESWATVGAYADRVARDGQELLWGPGRHGPGFNIFTYLLDPEGAVVEAYTDLFRVENDAAYIPVDWSTEPRAMNLWGPGLPDGWDERGVPVLTP